MKATTNFALPYPEPADNSQTWTYWQGLAEAVDAIVPKTVTVTGSATFPNTSSANVAVTFPSGSFTAAPYCSTNFPGGSIFFTNATAITASGCNLAARYYLNTARTDTIDIQCIATQSFDSVAVALSARAADPETVVIDGVTYTLRTVVCHTDGCGNTGTACQVYVAEGGAVQCGVCGNAITDIT